MSITTDAMNSKAMTLIVSLPKNDLELAKCAWENGADAIKIHINLSHHASQTQFHSYEQEAIFIKTLLEQSPIPVGIVLGDNTMVAENALNEISKLSFDFVSLYGHHMPLALGKNRKIKTFFAIDGSYSYDDVRQITTSEIADILELSVLKKDEYGTRLCLRSLLMYENYVKHAFIPTLLPSQHFLVPSDIKLLNEIGIKGVMIGAIVTGTTVDSMKEAVIAFRTAIDAL